MSVLRLLPLNRRHDSALMLARSKFKVPDTLPCSCSLAQVSSSSVDVKDLYHSTYKLAIFDGNCHAGTDQSRFDMGLSEVSSLDLYRYMLYLQACHQRPRHLGGIMLANGHGNMG